MAARKNSTDEKVVVSTRNHMGPNNIFVTVALQEAQLPLRHRASATYFYVANLMSIAHSCL